MGAASRSEEHVGEWKLSIQADTPEEIFQEAARVMAQECGPVGDQPGQWRDVSLEARDRGTLLVDWINELVGLSEVDGVAYDEVAVDSLTDTSISARVRGRPALEYQSALKAATYHGLTFEKQDGYWVAEVILDI